MNLPVLSVEIDDVEGFPVIRAFGEIDLYTVPEFDRALKAVADREVPIVIVDLTGISYLDSAGLSALLSAYRRLSARDGALYVVASPHAPGVRRALEITRLDSLMYVRESLDSVLAELQIRRAA